MRAQKGRPTTTALPHAILAEASMGGAGNATYEQILLEGVSKTFLGSVKPALRHIDLVVNRGDFYTIIGPSGAGKSTLLRILAGLLQPDAGRVSIFGETPRDASRSKHLGWVPQAPALLPWRNVLDNVRLPLQVNRRAGERGLDPMDILARLGLEGAAKLLPAQLSGGMRQRVAIARAFAIAPSLLLMDEPFAALDELTRESVAHQLLELWQDERRTVVFVTHSVTEAVMLSDRVAVMGDGALSSAFEVPLPRPRAAGVEDTEEFQELVRLLRAQLKVAWFAAY
ncbi:MAG: ABC transporter ATP-binding protein [Acidimicrobiales bacterium]